MFNTLNAKQQVVVLAAYNNEGKVPPAGVLGGKFRGYTMTVYALRTRGWLKHPDEPEPERLGRKRMTPKALHVQLVLSAAAREAVAEHLANSTE